MKIWFLYIMRYYLIQSVWAKISLSKNAHLLVVLENRLNQEKVASNLNKLLITEEIVNKKFAH